LNLNSPNAEDFTIEEFIMHENFNSITKHNDIAVVKINHDACDSPKFPLTIRPACLWQTEFIWQNQGIASGWGSTDYASSTSNELMKVRLDVLDSSRCSKIYNEEGLTIDQKQICAGVLVGGRDTCHGGEFEEVFCILIYIISSLRLWWSPAGCLTRQQMLVSHFWHRLLWQFLWCDQPTISVHASVFLPRLDRSKSLGLTGVSVLTSSSVDKQKKQQQTNHNSAEE
jgi:Trypsin